jgi:hypothetical protein
VRPTTSLSAVPTLGRIDSIVDVKAIWHAAAGGAERRRSRCAYGRPRHHIAAMTNTRARPQRAQRLIPRAGAPPDGFRFPFRSARTRTAQIARSPGTLQRETLAHDLPTAGLNFGFGFHARRAAHIARVAQNAEEARVRSPKRKPTRNRSRRSNVA